MLGLPVQIGHEGCIAFFLESIELCTLCGTHICGNYVIESTCYSVKSERIYTCQKEMEDLQIEVIKSAFVRSLNEKLEHRDVVLGNLKEIRNLISGGERTLQQQTALWEESRLLEEQIQALIMQNARIAMDQEQYQKEFDELVERHSRMKQEYEEQAIATEQDVGRVAQIDYFISTLEELNAPVTEFDEQLWISMVDHVVVHSKEDIRVVYRDGIEK